jgi:hypothetical protein
LIVVPAKSSVKPEANTATVFREADLSSLAD